MKIRVTVSGSPLEVGAVLEVTEVPAWLVNKCVVVEESRLEVATPEPEKQKRTYTRKNQGE